MRLRGKLLRTIAQQREGGDDHPIDPATVHFDPDASYALRPNFDLAGPVIGSVKVTRAIDGSLDAVATLYPVPRSDGMPTPMEIPYIVRFAIGTRGGKLHDGVQCDTWLTQISLTEKNVDRGMPLARVEG